MRADNNDTLVSVSGRTQLSDYVFHRHTVALKLVVVDRISKR